MLRTKATFLLRSMIVDLKILAADFVSILLPLGALWSVSPRLLKLDSRPQNCALPIAEKMFTGQCSVVLPPPKFFICSHTGHGEQCPVRVQCKCPVVLPGLKLYIRPHLDYGDVIYQIPDNICEFSRRVILNGQMDRLESIQYSAALALTGTWKGTSREKLYDELGWEPLLLCWWSRRLILLYKIVRNGTPNYTRCPIPTLHISHYNLRRHISIGQICARTRNFK